MRVKIAAGFLICLCLQPLPVAHALRIVVAFGYKDTRPARLVGDRYERMILVQRLLKMGFKRNPLDETEFENPRYDISLQVFHASVGPDDDENEMDPYQDYQSDYAKTEFYHAIQTADVVLYNGHSRDGGGPDFESPKRLSNGHVDYTWYQKERKSFQDLLNVWNASEHKPKELALISCYSELHFSKPLKAAGMKITTIPQLIYYSDALEKVVEIINGYLKQS